MKQLLIAVLAVASLSFGACAYLQQPETRAKLADTGRWLAGKATQIALNTIVSAAQSQADASKKADWLDSLSTGLRTQATASFSSNDLRSLAAIWTPEKPHWGELAAQLAALVEKSRDLPPAARAEAVAQALNTAAAQARALPPSAFVAPVQEHLEDAGGNAPFPIVITSWR